MNPTHQISWASITKSPLCGTATQMFLLLTSGAYHVRLWEVVWGFEGGVTSTRRAWPVMGDFLSHGGSGCPFYHAAQCGTDSWVTLRKKSMLCLQKITLLSSLLKLAVMITVWEASWICSYFSFLHERQTIMVVWHCFFLPCKQWCLPFLDCAAKQ